MFEHNLMAAFVFPLIVKKLLADESKYTLTEDDAMNLGVIDKLLDAKNWFNSPELSTTLVT